MSEGFGARTIFVYAGRKDQRKKTFDYNQTPEQQAMLDELAKHFLNLTTIYGQVEPTPEAYEWVKDWYENHNHVINPDRKLGDYYGRKKQHLMKLAMCVHFAESDNLTITKSDIQRALELLNSTEISMSKALQGTSGNPLAVKGEKILDYITENKRVSRKELLAHFWDELKSPTQDMEAILGFLIETDKIMKSPVQPDTYILTKEHREQQERRELAAYKGAANSEITVTPSEASVVKTATRTTAIKKIAL